MKMKKLIAAIMTIITSFYAFGVSAGAFGTYLDAISEELYKDGAGKSPTDIRAELYQVIKTEAVKRYLRNIDPNWTDAQKVAYLYTNIVNQGRHRTTDSPNADILYNGYGVCNTFSAAFNYACNNLGIRSMRASPAIKGVDHDINLVEIDGKWYELDSDGGNHFLYGTNNTRNVGKYNQPGGGGIFPTVEAYSPYNEYTDGNTYYNGAYNAHYFEYNGQWFRYDNTKICKIDNSLYCASAEYVFSLFGNAPASELKNPNGSPVLSKEDSWGPGCFAYDDNGHLYYDWKNNIYCYDAATNTSSKVFTLSKTIAGSNVNKKRNGYGSQPSTHAPFQWFGIDKYALYYVCLDGSYGTIALGSDNTHLELTSDSKTIGIGEYAFVAPMASTRDKCGDQVSFSTKNNDVIQLFEGGIIRGKKAGKVTVTVSAYGRSNTYTVTVKDGTTTENVVGDAFYLNKGSKVDLSYLFSFDSNSKIKYTSSDKSIVKVTSSSGKSYIKGVKTGEAVITATCGSEKKILKVNVIKSSNETTSMSVSSKFAEYSDRMNKVDRLLGDGAANNCTMQIDQILLSVNLNKSSTDVVNWVGEDAKYVDASRQTFGTKFDNTFVFIWDGMGVAGRRTLYCVTSSGKIKPYTFDVKAYILTSHFGNGETATENFSTGEVVFSDGRTYQKSNPNATNNTSSSSTSKASYTKNDCQDLIPYGSIKINDTGKESLEDFMTDYAIEEYGSKTRYKNAKFYSLDTSVVEIIEKNGKHYPKCIKAEGNGGTYIVVVSGDIVEGISFIFKK